MYSIKLQTISEHLAKGSRFIAVAARVETVEAFTSLYLQTKSLYPSATHYCYAYIIGDNQEHQKASDDGEPAKTAGQPLLEAIKKKNLTDVALIVVRYFGGTKLGTGGLIRAYGKAGREALDDAQIIPKLDLDSIEISFGYEYQSSIDHFLQENAKVITKEFTEKVSYIISSEHKHTVEIISALTNMTKGEITPRIISSTKTYNQ
jgi:uncharacterized YigZ family protein